AAARAVRALCRSIRELSIALRGRRAALGGRCTAGRERLDTRARDQRLATLADRNRSLAAHRIATLAAYGDGTGGQSILSVIALAVWRAVLLGLAVQGLILGAKVAAGGHATTPQLLVDVTSGVTWSALVCSGIAVGTVTARHRAAI